MSGDPVGDLLGAARFRVRVVRGAQDGHEQLDLDHLAGGGIDHRGLLACIVDEHLLAAPVELPHRQPPMLQPAPVELAELRVPIAVGVVLKVLEVEQLERHAGLAPLGMEVGTVGNRALMGGRRQGPIEAAVERRIVQRLDLGPVKSRRGRATPSCRRRRC
jgi:hypothetical protein